MVAARRDASAITRSPALSHSTTSRGLVTSGVEYSGWAWSTYRRAPVVSNKVGSPRSPSAQGQDGADRGPGEGKPRAARGGDSPPQSPPARPAPVSSGRAA